MKKYIQPHSYVVEISTTNRFLNLSVGSTTNINVDPGNTRNPNSALSEDIDVNSDENWSD